MYCPSCEQTVEPIQILLLTSYAPACPHCKGSVELQEGPGDVEEKPTLSLASTPTGPSPLFEAWSRGTSEELQGNPYISEDYLKRKGYTRAEFEREYLGTFDMSGQRSDHHERILKNLYDLGREVYNYGGLSAHRMFLMSKYQREFRQRMYEYLSVCGNYYDEVCALVGQVCTALGSPFQPRRLELNLTPRMEEDYSFLVDSGAYKPFSIPRMWLEFGARLEGDMIDHRSKQGHYTLEVKMLRRDHGQPMEYTSILVSSDAAAPMRFR